MPPSTARNRCRHRAGIEPDCAEEHRGEHNAADAHGDSRPGCWQQALRCTPPAAQSRRAGRRRFC